MWITLPFNIISAAGKEAVAPIRTHQRNCEKFEDSEVNQELILKKNIMSSLFPGLKKSKNDQSIMVEEKLENCCNGHLELQGTDKPTSLKPYKKPSKKLKKLEMKNMIEELKMENSRLRQEQPTPQQGEVHLFPRPAFEHMQPHPEGPCAPKPHFEL